MIQREKLFCSFSVKDADEAYDFYKNILGLKMVKDEEMSVLSIQDVDLKIMMYPKPDHIPATYTILNIPVTNIEQAVDQLSKKGITFLQYDLEQIKTDSKGIARSTDGPTLAWLTDPSGNIISLIQE